MVYVRRWNKYSISDYAGRYDPMQRYEKTWDYNRGGQQYRRGIKPLLFLYIYLCINIHSYTKACIFWLKNRSKKIRCGTSKRILDIFIRLCYNSIVVEGQDGGKVPLNDPSREMSALLFTRTKRHCYAAKEL